MTTADLAQRRRPATFEPTVSAIIPVHRVDTTFTRCLACVAGAIPASDEIIVVADGEDGRAASLAHKFGARAVVVSGPSGPARARNAGAALARGDILLFLDADVAVHPDVVQRVRAAFGTRPEVAAVIGSYDEDPADPGFLSQYRNLLHHYVHQTAREEGSTFWGACGAIRREVFLAMGGFSEAYRAPSVEDIELGYRLRAAGHGIWLCKGLQVKHLKRWNAVSMVETDFFRRALPWTELILREGRFINDLNLKLPNRISVLVAFGLVGCLVARSWWPHAAKMSVVLCILLMGLNMPVYAFFWRRRGPGFALRAIPWHWFSYLYSGLAFAVGTVRHVCRTRRRRGLEAAGASQEMG